jgi:UDP-N-acetyl-D-glucosamine dehydrogenase
VRSLTRPVPPPRVIGQPTVWREALRTRLGDRTAQIGVVGLGYVGLPLFLHVRRAGFAAVGVDSDTERITAIRAGRSFVVDVPDEELLSLDGTLRTSTRSASLRGCDVVIICVPTPLADNQPDLHFVKEAATGIARHLRPGMLIVLESTTYPGTTEEIVRPILEESLLVAGQDFALAYAPERIDPGRGFDHLAETPRIVGGLTPECASLAVEFYASFVKEVHVVSSPREAEMAKLLENTFRHVNIALANELAFLSRDLDVDLWEAIRAASTKPFGYMPFWPGPGVGGHCIAIDPSYLSWRVGQRTGHRLNFVEHAQEVNARMPGFVAQRIGDALNSHSKPLRDSRILGIGVSYKADVGDMRESPAVLVLELLAAAGSRVSYHDPFVPEISLGGRTLLSQPLTKRTLSAQDCVAILTAHTGLDVPKLIEASSLVFDTRGVTRGVQPNVVRL